MTREPRTRLPWAGILIIFVAPLASLMVIIPSLFAGSVTPVRNPLPNAVTRILSNLPAWRNSPPQGHARVPAPTPSLPPVAGAPTAPTAAPPPAFVPPVAAPAGAAAGSPPATESSQDADDTRGHGKGRGDGDDKHGH